MKQGIGLDFGSEEIRVGLPSQGIVYRQPCVVAEDRSSKAVVKFGSAAQKLVAESPELYRTYQPFRGDWLLSDTRLTASVMRHAMKGAGLAEEDLRLLISIPCSLSEEEEAALCEVAHTAGYKEALLVYSPIAALIGDGHSMEKTVLSVNVGLRNTDIVVLADGEIIYRASAPVGGFSFSLAIAEYVYSKYGLSLQMSTAEDIKRRIGTVWEDGESARLKVTGRGSDRAMRNVVLTSDDMFNALEEPCAKVLEAIHNAVSAVPLHAVNGLLREGIYLSGGGTLLKGLREMIAGVTGFRTTLVTDPTDAVANGLAKILLGLPSRLYGINVSMVAVKTNSYLD
ncbi:MAG: rod shape-determining protein [Clostridia bacterium]|nr:rod shape-determining protein [Clostridia bacterium]